MANSRRLTEHLLVRKKKHMELSAVLSFALELGLNKSKLNLDDSEHVQYLGVDSRFVGL